MKNDEKFEETFDQTIRQTLRGGGHYEKRVNTLNRAILERAGQTEVCEMKEFNKKRKMPMAAAVAAAVLVLSGVTAMAASGLLTGKSIGERLEDRRLGEALEAQTGQDVLASVEQGGYRFSLVAIASGRDLSEWLTSADGEIENDRTYAAVAIQRSDGEAFAPWDDVKALGEDFYVSPYIQGCDPAWVNINTLGGGYSAFMENGVYYRVIETTNLTPFADREVYVGISSGSLYDSDAFLYDPLSGSGAITPNPDFDGVSVLMTLPLDKSLADKDAADEILSRIEAMRRGESTDDDADDAADVAEKTEAEVRADAEVAAFMEKLTPENLADYAEPVAGTKETAPPSSDGYVAFSYELESGAAGEGLVAMDDLFPDGKTGMSENFDYNYSEGVSDLLISTYTLNDDGTVTFELYRAK